MELQLRAQALKPNLGFYSITPAYSVSEKLNKFLKLSKPLYLPHMMVMTVKGIEWAEACAFGLKKC